MMILNTIRNQFTNIPRWKQTCKINNHEKWVRVFSNRSKAHLAFM